MSRAEKLKIVPLTMGAANQVVENIHRHHGAAMALSPAFAIGCVVQHRLCGAAVAGRPINRHNDDGTTLEILRVATDGTSNASSCLLRGCVRIAREMGFCRVITYTLSEESGASLMGAGYDRAGFAKKTEWHRNYPSNQKKNRGNYRAHAEKQKVRWEVRIREATPAPQMSLADPPEIDCGQLTLAEGVEETNPADQPGSAGAMPVLGSIEDATAA
jgi:hypothetical protein